MATGAPATVSTAASEPVSANFPSALPSEASRPVSTGLAVSGPEGEAQGGVGARKISAAIPADVPGP
eukprot:9338670-Alexandrium_andersonii.AAC.1